MKRKSDKKTNRAFGLIETLIACAILIIVTGALLALNVIITNGIFFSKQRAQAYNLAQEGIESVKQIRNSNFVDGNSNTLWNSLVCVQGASPAIQAPSTTTTYIVSSGSFASCSSMNRIYLIPRTTLSQGDITIEGQTYNRAVFFQDSGLADILGTPAQTRQNAIRAIVTVTWIANGRDQSVELKSVLTNWKQAL